MKRYPAFIESRSCRDRKPQREPRDAAPTKKPICAAFDLEADLHLLALHRELRSGTYRPSPYRVTLVRDPKTRLVAAPAMRDRVLQRSLLDTIGPTYERGFIDHSYAVRSGRGAHRAVLAYLGWMRRYRFRLHLDIRHYFASVDHTVLLSLFAHRLQDPDTLILLAQLLEAGGAVYHHPLAGLALGPGLSAADGRGLPLGGYLSHWSGGFYRLRHADELGPERLARSLRAYRGMWSALGEG